ncbi:MAG: hypothetical protein A2Y41_10685 [Spirochaetes bacterium GWB1_36_13]|nr:MAG: hypothetical protein A2Y41_10685 [Spirochaetes bacterium GWB1_36_13]
MPVIVLFFLFITASATALFYRKKLNQLRIFVKMEDNRRKEKEAGCLKHQSELKKNEKILEEKNVNQKEFIFNRDFLILMLSIELNNLVETIPNINCKLSSSKEHIEKATVNTVKQLNSMLGSTVHTVTEVFETIKEKLKTNISKEKNTKESLNIEEVHKKYESLLNEVVEDLALIIQKKTEDVGKLDDIKNKIKNISTFSKKINKMTQSTKLLSFNARIESSKAGAFGKSFGVVATEMGKLASESELMVKKIEFELKQTGDFIENSIIDIKNAMDVETKFLNSTIIILKDVFLSVLNSLTSLSVIMEESLTGENSKFSQEIKNITYSLQFEDITRQVFESLIHSLDKIYQRIKNMEIYYEIEKNVNPSLIRDLILQETQRMDSLFNSSDTEEVFSVQEGNEVTFF